MHYVYILKSLKDNNLYYGYTNNLPSRLKKHNEGKVYSTQARRPLKLVYYEAFISKEDAQDRERYFKTGWGRNYIKKHLKRSLEVK